MAKGSEVIKSKKTKRPRVKVYPAPPKSRAAYFFAAFCLTLAASLSCGGFFIAYDHSLKVGSGRSVAAFAVSQSGGGYDVTVAGNSFLINTAFLDKTQQVLSKLGSLESTVEPAPIQLAKYALARLDLLEESLLSRYSPI